MRIANAPVSWGNIEFESAGGQLDSASVLDEIRATGYVGTELGDWGFLPTEPTALRQQLSARGLTLVAGFVPVALSRPEALPAGQERALATARLMADAVGDGPLLILSDDNGVDPVRTQMAGRIGAAQGLPKEGRRQLAQAAMETAKEIRAKAGLRTAFHHHCAGFVETADEIHAFLRDTESDVIGLCLDTGHLVFGGGDPADIVDRYGDRIWHVHFKDCSRQVAARSRQEGWDYLTSVRQGVFCELGQGAVDFQRVIESLKRAGYDDWIVVEQDVLPGMGTPKESALRNRAYLKNFGL